MFPPLTSWRVVMMRDDTRLPPFFSFGWVGRLRPGENWARGDSRSRFPRPRVGSSGLWGPQQANDGSWGHSEGEGCES